MKSPNAEMSMKLLNVAEQAIKTAYEDLKNDERIRDARIAGNKLTEMLQYLEQELKSVQAALKKLGY